MSVDYLLHESALGYAIFKVVNQPDTIGNRLKEVQEAVQDLAKFGKTVELVGLTPFQGTQDALQEINDVSEGMCPSESRASRSQLSQTNAVSALRYSKPLPTIDSRIEPAQGIQEEEGCSRNLGEELGWLHQGPV